MLCSPPTPPRLSTCSGREPHRELRRLRIAALRLLVMARQSPAKTWTPPAARLPRPGGRARAPAHTAPSGPSWSSASHRHRVARRAAHDRMRRWPPTVSPSRSRSAAGDARDLPRSAVLRRLYYQLGLRKRVETAARRAPPQTRRSELFGGPPPEPGPSRWPSCTASPIGIRDVRRRSQESLDWAERAPGCRRTEAGDADAGTAPARERSLTEPGRPGGGVGPLRHALDVGSRFRQRPGHGDVVLPTSCEWIGLLVKDPRRPWR